MFAGVQELSTGKFYQRVYFAKLNIKKQIIYGYHKFIVGYAKNSVYNFFFFKTLLFNCYLTKKVFPAGESFF
ncbi:hypothetical protein FHS11_003218 [Mucilaginibacter gotjawali]|uniref:Uncharacterized protein n=1 Tax=Mucilaginibacter gotjawali TaxID=1550579 RepID=A0A839SHH6_9SPHI|nr:hypothetical protein [Mucilaginibacter gotjawali]